MGMGRIGHGNEAAAELARCGCSDIGPRMYREADDFGLVLVMPHDIERLRADGARGPKHSQTQLPSFRHQSRLRSRLQAQRIPPRKSMK